MALIRDSYAFQFTVKKNFDIINITLDLYKFFPKNMNAGND